MKLPQSKIRQMYIDQIKDIEKDLKDVTSNKVDKKSLISIQEQIDIMAKKYQENEEIGTAKYKLYELQALIHYFNDNDNDALDFINQAIETRGEKYERAEKLKAQILAKNTHSPKTTDPINMTKKERRKKLIGLEGWLALFIVSLGVSILLGIFNLFGYSSVFSDLSSASGSAKSYVDAITPALWFEIVTNIISLGVAICLIVSLMKHRRFAITIAIIYLVTSAAFLTIDYAWASSVFETFNIKMYVEADLQKASSNTGKAIIAAFIWIPYFLLSRRVKATLIE